MHTGILLLTTALFAKLPRTLVAVVAVVTLALVALSGAPSAQAAPESTPLSLTVVGQSGPYFDLTMSPGETRTLQVNRTNPGAGAVTALCYTASVFTIVNGGFGAKGGGGPSTGATKWVRFADEVFPLAAGETNTKDFTVTVPAGTAPGQYISSIVLQNNDALPGQGQVALDRVIRQAVAISILVPGRLNPGFSLGAASNEKVAGRSVVSVALKNEGNQNLKPTGTMTVKDAAKAVVSEAPVSLGSIYAGMDTTVAVTLDGLLQPGDYTVTLVLTDPATGVGATENDVAFRVLPPEGVAQSAISQLPAIVQDAIQNPGMNTLILILILLILAGLAAGGCIVLRRHWKKKRPASPEPDVIEPHVIEPDVIEPEVERA